MSFREEQKELKTIAREIVDDILRRAPVASSPDDVSVVFAYEQDVYVAKISVGGSLARLAAVDVLTRHHVAAQFKGAVEEVWVTYRDAHPEFFDAEFRRAAMRNATYARVANMEDDELTNALRMLKKR